ncbi:MAG: flavin reductase family protein [Candidatus Bathyarchaeota archaeon]|nr:flavin reductase family protein [Candidatus Bathyarchaeota archaeon]
MGKEWISKLIFPRVTGLITTCSRDGKPNVAAFSFLMPVSFDPKYVAFSVAPSRFTFSNLSEVKEFVLNIPDESLAEKVWICGTVSGRKQDKFGLAGFTIVKSVKVKPPRIAECPVQLEGVVEFSGEFGDHYVIVGKIVEEHVKTLDFKPLLHYHKNVFYRVGEELKV